MPGSFLSQFTLDQTHLLMRSRDVSRIKAAYDALDDGGFECLELGTFTSFVQANTTLTKRNTHRLFDILDSDLSGAIDFPNFYLLVCILVAMHTGLSQDFLLKHASLVFELLDADSSSTISADEFKSLKLLFDIDGSEVFKDFDLDGSDELDFEEVRHHAHTPRSPCRCCWYAVASLTLWPPPRAHRPVRYVHQCHVRTSRKSSRACLTHDPASVAVITLEPAVSS